jgi:hypothetical protein
MSAIVFEDLVFVLGVLLAVGLREYVGWLCISEAGSKACGTCGRCRRAHPDERLLARGVNAASSRPL